MLTNEDKSGNSAKSAINKNSIVSSLHRRLKQFARVLQKRLAVYEPPPKISDLKNMNLSHLSDTVLFCKRSNRVMLQTLYK